MSEPKQLILPRGLGNDVAGKKALTGLQRLGLAPILKDDAEGYEVDTTAYFPIQHMQSLSRNTNESETKFHGDDVLYASIKEWGGITMTVSLLEMRLADMERLGFGVLDPVTKELDWDPEGRQLEVALSFAMQSLDRNFRMFRAHKALVTGLKETDSQTKGDGTQINNYELTLEVARRNYDGVAATYKDTESRDDLVWLKEFPKLP